jgi:hypothetical protein
LIHSYSHRMEVGPKMTDRTAIIIACIGIATPTAIAATNFIQMFFNHRDNKAQAEATRLAVENNSHKVDLVGETAEDTNAQVVQVAQAVNGRLQQFLALTEKLGHSKGFLEGIEEENARHERKNNERAVDPKE